MEAGENTGIDIKIMLASVVDVLRVVIFIRAGLELPNST
jgi:hypothetical protein